MWHSLTNNCSISINFQSSWGYHWVNYTNNGTLEHLSGLFFCLLFQGDWLRSSACCWIESDRRVYTYSTDRLKCCWVIFNFVRRFHHSHQFRFVQKNKWNFKEHCNEPVVYEFHINVTFFCFSLAVWFMWLCDNDIGVLHAKMIISLILINNFTAFWCLTQFIYLNINHRPR